MGRYFFVILLFLWKITFSQVSDNFSDENFTVNPIWAGSGSSGDFTVVANQLRSNSTLASSNFYISTANTLAGNCTWEFVCNIRFNPSGLNYTDVYLISDQADLQSTNINGYFVRIGNSEDEISLYKRTGAKSTSVKIIDGINGSVNVSNTVVRIKVTRTADNEFKLDRDLTGTDAGYFTEGTVTDTDHTSTSYFGVFVQQSTATFFQKHFFDDFDIREIIIDTTPPDLLSARAIDSLTVELEFSEAVDSTLAKNISNYVLSGPGTLQSVTVVNSSRYKLHVNPGLQTASYALTISNIKDLNGNSIGAANSIQFSFIKPYIAGKNDVAINEIFADPSPQVDLPALEFIELWNTTNHVISLNNWKFSDPASSYTFGSDSIQPNEHLLLCARADTLEFKRFGRVIGVSPWPSLNNTGDVLRLVSDRNVLINEVSYQDSWYHDAVKKQGGYTLERVDPLSNCEGFFNWTSSHDLSGGTPGAVNSAYFQNYDQLIFKADSIKQNSDTTVSIYFNKPIDQSTTASGAFVISPAFSVLKSVSVDAEAKQVTLTYPLKFLPSTDFGVSVQFIKDCSGTGISAIDQPLIFSTGALPPVRLDTARMFITEFLADPSPEEGLPLVEFVEIYNPGNDTINLDGWTLSDASTKSTLRNSSIAPKQYLILCSAADTSQYKNRGKVTGLSPWPILGNTSDQIILRSFKNRTVDSIAYNDVWYGDLQKKSGGWSLERIDPFSACSDLSWAASKDSTGGTPGTVNSIYQKDYDRLTFHADSLKRFTDSTVVIYFNKIVDVSTVIAANFTLSPSAASIKSAVLNSGYNQVSLTFDQNFLPSTTYSVSLQGVNDCGGQALSALNQPLSFTTPALPPPPPIRLDTARMFITEFLADPSPEVGLPLVEFVEIYNPGNDTINLDGWTLSDASTKSTLRNSSIAPKQYLILCPAADTSQYKNRGKVTGLSPWPILGNTSDQIILRSFKNRTVDSIAYNDVWYGDLQKKSGGWSLERIDPFSACSDLSWAASKDTTGGTPGTVNSIYQKEYDQLPFHADSLKRFTDSTVMIYFNKIVDASTVITGNFTLSPSAGSIRRASLNTGHNQVSLTFDKNFLPSTTYSVSLLGVDDCGGQELSALNQPLTFTTPALPPPPPVRLDTARMFVTEFLADPSPEVGLPLVEFVEIYNPGNDTINLDGWTLSDASTRSTLRNSSIAPKQYLILCSAADTSQYKNRGKVTGLSPWPILGNTSDQIILRSFKNRTVDSVAYNDVWYRDLQKKSGGWSLERIGQSTCTGWYGWAASLNALGGTPGEQNSNSQPAILALKLDSLRILSDTTLKVFLNMIPDTLFLNPGNFHLNGHVASSIKPSSDFKSFILDFSNQLIEGISYSLVAKGLRTCSGLIIASPDNQLNFSIPLTPELNYPVVINEIFADSSPVAGLPDAEFIELYNPTDQSVALEGLMYGDTTTRYVFLSGVIEPGGYLILCQNTDTLSFKPYGEVHGIHPWPGLNNEKDFLTLKNNKGKEIYRVNYHSGWHADKLKQTGGWSLELMSPDAVCSGKQNWTSSTDLSGGTPGRVNSVFSSHSSGEVLKLVSVVMKDSTSLLLTFNRAVDSLSVSKPGNYQLNNGVGHPVNSVALTPGFTQVELTFANRISRGNTYRVNVESITDCAGTVISPVDNSAEFFFPDKIEKGDILINEILFNPRKSGSDFVEIYNNSGKKFDLKNLSLATVRDSLTGIRAVSTVSQLFEPGKYLVLSADPDNVKKEYQTEDPDAFLKMPSVPSFNDDEGVVVLLSDKTRIDELTYSEKMHHLLIKDSEGVSLERSSFKIPTADPGNFRSAAGSKGFATPGYRNSQFLEEVLSSDEIFLSSKTFSPDNDGFEDVLQVNYNFTEPGLVANINIYNDRGILVKRLAKNLTLAVSGSLFWDGQNEQTEKAPVGIYIAFLEIFDLQGRVKKYKRSFALAGKLN